VLIDNFLLVENGRPAGEETIALLSSGNIRRATSSRT